MVSSDSRRTAEIRNVGAGCDASGEQGGMQYLWIGCVEDDEEFERKAEKGYKLASAQVSQKNLIGGIEDCVGIVFDTINGAVTPAYPQYADKVVDEVRWSHRPGARDVSVGYRNDRYVNRLNCERAMLAAAEEWVESRYAGGPLTVIAYSMRSAPMRTACYIKQHVKDARTYLVVTDLPAFMDLGQSKVKKLLKDIDWKRIKRMQSDFDGFILYAAPMAQYLGIPDGKWLLMEGSYDAGEPATDREAPKKRAVMYSGTLDREYGIPMLLDAFSSIRDGGLELWLTGGGNAEELIRSKAQEDARIKFFGFLPSRRDVVALQREASLLLNMRLPSEEASSYCFPSKLFEYMATGTPVLTFRLGGIPEEYYRYLVTVDAESADRLAGSIVSALQDGGLRGLGAAARDFVIRQKNTRVQAERVLGFMDSGRRQ